MFKIKYVLFIALAAFVLWFVSYYRKAMQFVNAFSYNYKITSVHSDVLKRLSELGTGKLEIAVNFQMWLKNPTDFSITLTNLQIDFFHGAEMIGRSTKFSPILISQNSTSQFSGNAIFAFNKALAQTALSASNKFVRIDYVAKFKAFGLPFYLTYKSFYTANVLDYI
jgi:LEA14-like dessication related protein